MCDGAENNNGAAGALIKKILTKQNMEISNLLWGDLFVSKPKFTGEKKIEIPTPALYHQNRSINR